MLVGSQDVGSVGIKWGLRGSQKNVDSSIKVLSALLQTFNTLAGGSKEVMLEELQKMKGAD